MSITVKCGLTLNRSGLRIILQQAAFACQDPEAFLEHSMNEFLDIMDRGFQNREPLAEKHLSVAFPSGFRYSGHDTAVGEKFCGGTRSAAGSTDEGGIRKYRIVSAIRSKLGKGKRRASFLKLVVNKP